VNLKRCANALLESIDDPANAGRLVLLYVSEASGIFAFRPGCDFVQLGGSDDGRGAGPQLEAFVAQLWPDAPARVRQLITILAHAAGKKRGLGALLGSADDVDD
jgi:hypothetical protein